VTPPARRGNAGRRDGDEGIHVRAAKASCIKHL
jgi:hypothetical protein